MKAGKQLLWPAGAVLLAIVFYLYPGSAPRYGGKTAEQWLFGLKGGWGFSTAHAINSKCKYEFCTTLSMASTRWGITTYSKTAEKLEKMDREELARLMEAMAKSPESGRWNALIAMFPLHSPVRKAFDRVRGAEALKGLSK